MAVNAGDTLKRERHRFGPTAGPVEFKLQVEGPRTIRVRDAIPFYLSGSPPQASARARRTVS